MPDAQSGPDATVTCSSNLECTDPTAPFCAQPGTGASACVGCNGDGQCADLDPTRPLCAPDGSCVACVDASDCADPMLPTCDQGTRVCRACAAGPDCGSQICNLDDGSCIPQGDIYYVDDNAGCGTGNGSMDTPFCTVDEALAAFAGAPRGFVYVLPGSYNFPVIASDTLPIFSGSADAVLTPVAPNGVCVTMSVTATLVIQGFRYTDCGTGIGVTGAGRAVIESGGTFVNNDRAIQCSAAMCNIADTSIAGGDFGVRCESGGNCLVKRTIIQSPGVTGLGAIGGSNLVIEDTTVLDAGGNGILSQDANVAVIHTDVERAGTTMSLPGIQCNGGTCGIRRSRVALGFGAGISIADVTDYLVENTAVVENGDPDGGLALNGGVVFSASTATATTQVFAHNTIYGNRAGVGEIGGVRCAMTNIENSILWSNTGGEATFGGCYLTDSDVDDTSVTGERLIMLDPMFVSTIPGAVDVHLMPASPCIDLAPAMTAVEEDIDGDVRPMPVGANSDMGVDEYMP